jgi:hypothetical protein
MTLDEFRTSATEPDNLTAPLRALWLDAAGHWETAHHRTQGEDSPDSAWVHAYLHRKEGNASNAGYWYTQAGRPAEDGPLAAEWENIARTLLAKRKEAS